MKEFWRFWCEESGTDLIEYALLTAFVGAASAAALTVLPGIVKTIYDGWDSGQEQSWKPCNPGTLKGPCPLDLP